MRRSEDFEWAVRRGVRSSRRLVVVHLAAGTAGIGPAMVGFVVSKTVGNAVTRNRVKRRLRAVVGQRIDQLPHGGRLVVRALPDSSAADSAALAGDFDVAFGGARRKLQQRQARR